MDIDYTSFGECCRGTKKFCNGKTLRLGKYRYDALWHPQGSYPAAFLYAFIQDNLKVERNSQAADPREKVFSSWLDKEL